MAKQGFWAWLILLIAGGLFLTGFFTEIQQKPLNLQNIGILLLFAYLIYRAITD